MEPTIGRMVHYIGHRPTELDDVQPKVRAAIITDVDSATDTVSLAVFTGGGIRDLSYVKQGTEVGCWQWPPRV